jgi:hypothetical protein
MQLVNKLKYLSLLINVLLKHINLDYHSTLFELNKKLKKRYPASATMKSVDPLLPVSQTIIFNRVTPLHTDNLDTLEGWAVLVALSTAKGSYLHTPSLGIRILYKPGLIIILRGHILGHKVEIFDKEQQITITIFTHSMLFREFKVVILLL